MREIIPKLELCLNNGDPTIGDSMNSLKLAGLNQQSRMRPSRLFNAYFCTILYKNNSVSYAI